MDYKPDPVLSALVAYRHSKTNHNFAGNLIWLLNYSKKYSWRDIPLFDQYFEGAQEGAKRLGYQIQTFDLQSEGMTSRRASEIFLHRGVSGIFIPPQEKAHVNLDLNWDDFSVISFGYTVENPKFHVVSSNHFRMMIDLINQLLKLGYRRPGLVLLKKSGERVENKWISAYLGKQWEADANNWPSPLILDTWDESTFINWLKKEAPDVVISGRRQIPELIPCLESSGYRIPEDIGFADHNMSDKNTATAGMQQNGVLIGTTGLEHLIGMIHRNEKGIPVTPTNTLVDANFYLGPTLKKMD